MSSCVTCKFWTKHNNGYDEGDCSELDNKVTVDVEYGWDGGYIRAYETDGDFCCSLYSNDNLRGD